MNDLISVVIPVYNVEKYIHQCLWSVSNQTYTNIDIILVDDGSTDNSGNICDEYVKQEKRANIIHKNNGGLSEARNIGIKVARGKYITFLDSDDFFEEDILEYLYMLIKNYDSDISTCGRINCDEKGTEIYRVECKSLLCCQGKEQMRQLFCNKLYDTTAWGKLYSMKLFDYIKFPVGKVHEDVYTTYLLVDNSQKTVIGCSAKYWYRQRENSITTSKYSSRCLDSIDANLIRAEFIKKNYPELLKYCRINTVYACIKCLERMFLSNYCDSNTEYYIKTILIKNMLHYIVNNTKIHNKVFVVMSVISIRFTRTVFQLSKKYVKKLKNEAKYSEI